MKLRRPQREPRPHPKAAEVAVMPDESVVYFNRERDIPEKDWEAMVRSLADFAAKEEWWKYDSLAASLMMLFPERRDDIEFDQGFYQQKMSELEQQQVNKDWEYYTDKAISLAFLFPERRGELELNDECFRHLKELNASEDLGKIVKSIFAIRLLYPKREGEFIADEVIFEKVREYMRSRDENSAKEVYTLSVMIVLLYPELRDELVFDQEVQKQSRIEMENCRGNDWVNFINTAVELAVASASDARRLDVGFELIYREEISEERKLPDRNLAS